MDLDSATAVLKEIKRIMDSAGVTFFLRQGTLLGAIRDNAFIPWDDDLDLGSVIGLHGLTEKSVDPVVATFRDNGYVARIDRLDHCLHVLMVRSAIRIEWRCYRVFGDSIYQYPAVQTPVSLFTDLMEIDFIGQKFLSPNPPEEYLRLKYGDEWMTPKQSGDFEADVTVRGSFAGVATIAGDVNGTWIIRGNLAGGGVMRGIGRDVIVA